MVVRNQADVSRSLALRAPIDIAQREDVTMKRMGCRLSDSEGGADCSSTWTRQDRKTQPVAEPCLPPSRRRRRSDGTPRRGKNQNARRTRPHDSLPPQFMHQSARCRSSTYTQTTTQKANESPQLPYPLPCPAAGPESGKNNFEPALPKTRDPGRSRTCDLPLRRGTSYSTGPQDHD